MNKTEFDPKKIFSFINKANSLFLLIGTVGFIFIRGFNQSDYFSFLLGWVFVVMNLEILKRIGFFLLAILNDSKINPLFYGFLLAKFCFWGLLVAAFHFISGIKGVSFMLGTLTLIFSGMILGVKEIVYARTS